MPVEPSEIEQILAAAYRRRCRRQPFHGDHYTRLASLIEAQSHAMAITIRMQEIADEYFVSGGSLDEFDGLAIKLMKFKKPMRIDLTECGMTRQARLIREGTK